MGKSDEEGETSYYLSIDFGASGACCLLGHLHGGKLAVEEVMRFETGFSQKGCRKVWNIGRFFEGILTALERCHEIGREPLFVGIDTWGVDFVLLDAEDNVTGDCISYRDSRTDGVPERAEKLMAFGELYRRTGIQKQKFNTIYQLLSLLEADDESLRRAKTMMMLPDYFNFLLTGEKHQEYTNATTTGLVNAHTHDWDDDIISGFKLPRDIFLPIEAPGRVIGPVRPEIAERIGYCPQVVMTASHDTASAIMAVPSAEKAGLYISSGTWSLMGTELAEPICTEESRRCNFTNEGGYEYRYRYLKNIMGLWMLQCVRSELAGDMTYGEIAKLAEQSRMTTIVDAGDERFMAPASMHEEIDAYCRERGLSSPETIGDYAAVIYNSLAECYRRTAEEIELLTGRTFDTINIIGGGANVDYLNRVTALRTGKRVAAGPSEGTALGNMAALMIAAGELQSLTEARSLIERSSGIRRYD